MVSRYEYSCCGGGVQSKVESTSFARCMLHNFGGNLEMYGDLEAVVHGPVVARKAPNSTMVGVGLCMEGIEHNPVAYELMSEMTYRHEPVHVEVRNDQDPG
jgi:alpha-N-acetylglucosaminidase